MILHLIQTERYVLFEVLVSIPFRYGTTEMEQGYQGIEYKVSIPFRYGTTTSRLQIWSRR